MRFSVVGKWEVEESHLKKKIKHHLLLSLISKGLCYVVYIQCTCSQDGRLAMMLITNSHFWYCIISMGMEIGELYSLWSLV